MGGDRRERRWERAVREHRAALFAFLHTARGVPAAQWERPLGEGKWSAAEVTEHLALSYDAALRERSGGGSMVPRVSSRRQTFLRWFLLPHMLFHRTMPRVSAPREVRPAPTGLGREEALERLRSVGERAEEAYRDAPHARLTHPYFGSLDRSQAFRLIALHIEHHQGQLRASAAQTRTG
jgi:hypothetical protein